jgi:hypothetical protein
MINAHENPTQCRQSRALLTHDAHREYGIKKASNSSVSQRRGAEPPRARATNRSLPLRVDFGERARSPSCRVHSDAHAHAPYIRVVISDYNNLPKHTAITHQHITQHNEAHRRSRSCPQDSSLTGARTERTRIAIRIDKDVSARRVTHPTRATKPGALALLYNPAHLYPSTVESSRNL